MDVNQDDKNLGMIAHGLVALTGLSSVLAALGPLGLLAAVASVVLYFVWKSKSPFVVRHAKQAAGLQAVLFIFGIIMGFLGSGVVAASVAAGSIGGGLAAGGLFLLLALAVGVAAVVLGIIGLLRAQKGEEFTYPVIGRWINDLNI